MGGDKEIGKFEPQRFDLPVSVTLDDKTPTPNNVIKFMDGIRDEDGSVNKQSPKINRLMNYAQEKGFDIVARADGSKITAVIGKWIADNPKYIRIGAGIILTTAVVAGAAGFILYKHHRESPEQK